MSDQTVSIINNIINGIPAIIGAFFVGVGGLIAGLKLNKNPKNDDPLSKYEKIIINYTKLSEKIDNIEKERNLLLLEVQGLRIEVKQLKETLKERDQTILELSLKIASINEEILENIKSKKLKKA